MSAFQQAASEDLVLAEFPAPIHRVIQHVTPATVSRELATEYSRPASERGVRRRELMTPEKHAAWWRYATRMGWVNE